MQFTRLTLSNGLPRRLAALAVVGLTATAACGDRPGANDVSGPGPSVDEQLASVSEQPATVFVGPAGPQAPWGTATIRRGPQGVQIHIRVTDAEIHAALAGNAITMWVASFHDPNECAGGPGRCAPADMLNPDVGGALQLGGGRVLGDGPINLALNVREGDDSKQVEGTATGLVDSGDEIHVIIRSHGPPVPGKVADQISEFGGGCRTIPPAPGVPRSPGPDPDGVDCQDPAVVIFL